MRTRGAAAESSGQAQQRALADVNTEQDEPESLPLADMTAESFDVVQGGDRSDHGEGEREPTPGVKRAQYVEDYTNSNQVFPFADFSFFIVRKMDQNLKRLLKRRITDAGGKLSPTAMEAQIIVIPYDPSDSMRKAINSVWGGDTVKASIVPPHWILRTYFDGYAAPVEAIRPTWEKVNIAVADLGDDELRLEVMIALERHGAILGPFETCQVCVVPFGHKWIKESPSGYEHIPFCSPEYIFDTVGMPMPVRFKPNPHPKALPKPHPKSRSIPKASARPISAARLPPGRARVARLTARQAFTASDRDKLARYIAHQRPEDKGRTSIRLYEHLVSAWEWGDRHTANAWREHHKQWRNREWHDGKVLNDMVEYYVDKEIDGDLKTAEERRAANRRGKSGQQRTVTADALRAGGKPVRDIGTSESPSPTAGRGRAAVPMTSPYVPLKNKRRREKDSDDEGGEYRGPHRDKGKQKAGGSRRVTRASALNGS